MPGWTVRFLIGLALIAVLGACGGQPPSGLLVDQYLAAVSGGSDDRGWSLLHPTTRSEMYAGDPSSYIRLAETQDWSAFTWKILRVTPDDLSLIRVDVEFPGGRDSIPEFLVIPRGNWWLLSIYPDEPGAPVMGLFLVRLPGGTGIWSFGG